MRLPRHRQQRVVIVIALAIIILFTLWMRGSITRSIENTPLHSNAMRIFPKMDLEGMLLLSNESEHSGHPLYQPRKYIYLPINVCSPTQKVLFVVASEVGQFGKRSAIRSTYGHKKWYEKYEVRTMFAVGKSLIDDEEAKLEKESAYYGDILQADFVDDYKNLTMKDLMWMRYVRDYCHNVQLVMYLTEDMLPNIFWFFDDFSAGRIPANRTFACMEFSGPIIRDPNSPWFVSPEAISEPEWGRYCSGMAYLVTTDLLADIVDTASAYQQYISVNSAFLTGTIGRKVNASIASHLYQEKFSLNPSETEHRMAGKEAAFGMFPSIDALKRIFEELLYIYRINVDKPDVLREPVKNAFS